MHDDALNPASTAFIAASIPDIKGAVALPEHNGAMGVDMDYVIPYRKGLLLELVDDLAKGQYWSRVGMRCSLVREDNYTETDTDDDFSDDDPEAWIVWRSARRNGDYEMPRPVPKHYLLPRVLRFRIHTDGVDEPDFMCDQLILHRSHGVVVQTLMRRYNWGTPSAKDARAAAYFEGVFARLDPARPVVMEYMPDFGRLRDHAQHDFDGGELEWLAELPRDLCTAAELDSRASFDTAGVDTVEAAVGAGDVEAMTRLLEGRDPEDFVYLAVLARSAFCLAALLARVPDFGDTSALLDLCIRGRDQACLSIVLERVRPTWAQVHASARAFGEDAFLRIFAGVHQ